MLKSLNVDWLNYSKESKVPIYKLDLEVCSDKSGSRPFSPGQLSFLLFGNWIIEIRSMTLRTWILSIIDTQKTGNYQSEREGVLTPNMREADDIFQTDRDIKSCLAKWTHEHLLVYAYLFHLWNITSSPLATLQSTVYLYSSGSVSRNNSCAPLTMCI
jgi:hypothetical protein